jgi:hypothetical protein
MTEIYNVYSAVTGTIKKNTFNHNYLLVNFCFVVWVLIVSKKKIYDL